jgi:hypothetical protein
MTRDDIIRMAREADNINCDCCLPDPDEEFMEDFLVAFAALVAAHEREACALVCDAIAFTTHGTAYACREAIRARGQA